MPDGKTQETIEAYLMRDDRMAATKVTFLSFDSDLVKTQRELAVARAERDALQSRLAELEADGS